MKKNQVKGIELDFKSCYGYLSKGVATVPEKFYLNKLRARKGLTQTNVAKDLGISVPTYNAWKKDLSNVSVSKVIALANYYDCKIDQIFLNRNKN